MTTQPSADGPVPPRRVGPYTLLAKIGEGGMGVVHLARHDGAPGPGAGAGSGGGDRVALKVMRPHIVGDEEARQRLAREVSSLRRIRSRWVAEILDADPWGEVPYVATRYVPGLSLHDFVEHEGPITGSDLTWFAGCLAEGLAAVHAAGVLHRDVKPSNVLMEGRTPVLIDFGLARVADDPRLTHTGWLLGTPGYLAPEILYGEDASPASDLHSWGATVAFAGTGDAPFGRGPAMAIMDRVRRGEHDLSRLPVPLRDVVAATLDPEPSRRPTLEQLLAWLRPQTTRPAPVLGEPPTLRLASPAAPDPFAAALALAAQTHEARPVHDDGTPGPPPGATSHPTVVMPRHPVAAPTLVEGPPPVLAPTPPAHGVPAGWPAPAPPRAPLAERARRLALTGAAAVLTGASCAVAPWVTLLVVVLAVWLLRSGSLAISAVGARRGLRGRRWYDAPQLLVHAPWHLVQSVPGAAMLLAWAGGIGVAAALLCYAVAADVSISLFVTGLVLALALWWGPGGSRLRGPLSRVIDPLSRRAGPWTAALVLVLGLSALAGSWVEARGTAWTPMGGQPFSTR